MKSWLRTQEDIENTIKQWLSDLKEENKLVIEIEGDSVEETYIFSIKEVLKKEGK